MATLPKHACGLGGSARGWPVTAESGGRQCFKEPRHAVSTARIADAAGCSVRVELQRRGTVHVQSHEVVETVEPSVAAGVGQGSALNPRKSVHDMTGIARGQQGGTEDSAIGEV